MKLVFMGTPAFAVPTLERTVEAGHEVVAVFTQPDRPKGRGQKDAMPPVKEAALRLGLPVHQPERVRRPEVVEQLRALAPEAMVVVGYGQIIPQAILDIPPQGIINVHASLLPKYRGAAPIQWAIARGETRTGVTTMRINAGLDTGDMLLKWETAIGRRRRGRTGRAPGGGGRGLAGARRWPSSPTIMPQPQDDAQATYAPILKKEDGKIDWTLSRARDPESDARIRAVARRVTDFCADSGFTSGKRGRLSDQKLPPGALRAVNRKLYAGCGREESLEMLEVQLEGKEANAGGSVSERISAERATRCWHESAARVSLRRDVRGISQGREGRPGADRVGPPASAAAVFTQNRVVAAPVVLARKNLQASRGQGVGRSWSTPATPTAPRGPATRWRCDCARGREGAGRQAGTQCCRHPPA